MVQVYQSSSSFSTGLLATRQLEVQASGALGTWVSDCSPPRVDRIWGMWLCGDLVMILGSSIFYHSCSDERYDLARQKS